MRSITRRRAIATIASAAGAGLAAPAIAQSKRRIAAVVRPGPGSTYGWDYEHERAFDAAREVHGSRAQIDIIHNVPQWGNGEDEIFRKLVRDGYEMIFTTSVGYMKSTFEVAFEAPNVVFENCAGYIRSNNIATYNIRWYEGRVPQGFLAANVTKSNRIGYLGAFPIPQVIRGINSAYLAARSVNPDIKFDVVWCNTWFNPKLEEQVAREMIDRGADVLMQHTGSTAPAAVAQENGIFCCGQASDTKPYTPDAVLTSSINNWGPYYIRRIGEFLDGTWQSTETWGGIGDEMIKIGDLLDTLPNRLHLQTEDLIDRIRTGKQHAFEGPIRKQNGNGWLAPGESAGDSDLLTMNYYVEGINAVFPSKS